MPRHDFFLLSVSTSCDEFFMNKEKVFQSDEP